MRRTLALLMLLTTPMGALRAQQRLSDVARQAREAVLRGDIGTLLGDSRGLQLRFPGVEPSSALQPPQAAATIRGLFRRGETSEVTVEDFRVVGEGRAFVELRRAFRAPGSQDLQTQRILLSYRQTRGGWQLVEFRAN